MIAHPTEVAPERAILDALKLAHAANISISGVWILVGLFDSEPGGLTSWRRLRTKELAIAAKVDYETARMQLRKIIDAGILEERKSRAGRGRDVRLSLERAHAKRNQQLQTARD